MYSYRQPTTSKMPNLKKFINPVTTDGAPVPEKKPLNGPASAMNQKASMGQQGSGQKQPQGQKASEGQKLPDNKQTVNMGTYSFPAASNVKPNPFSQERLQEAIIWSEILGKPACKKRKRRT